MITKLRSNKAHLASLLLFSLYALLHQPLLAVEPEKKDFVSSYEKLALAYLPSLVKEAQAEKLSEQEREKLNLKRLEALAQNANGRPVVLKASDIKLPTIGNVEKLELIYKLLQPCAQQVPTIPTNVLQDLGIFCGEPSDPQHHVFGAIDHTVTAIGKVELQRMLFEPQTDIAELQSRQEIIKHLIKNPKRSQAIEAYLQQIKTHENELLWFWKQVDETADRFLNQVCFGKKLGIDFSGLNKHSSVTNIAVLWSLLLSPCFNIFMQSLMQPIVQACIQKMQLMGGLPTQEQAKFQGINDADQLYMLPKSNHFIPLFAEQFKRMYYSGIADTISEYKKSNNGMLLILTAIYILNLILCVYGAVSDINSAYQFNSICNIIHTRMIHTASYIEAMNNLNKIVSTNPILNKMDKQFVSSSAQSHQQEDAQFKELLRLLNTSTMKGEPSVFSFKGSALTAFKLMQSTKDHLSHDLQLAGKLDAYLAIAKLVSHNPLGRYCFVNYQAHASAPYLKIDGFWHPMLNPTKVVVNNIELGTGNGARNAIITGPNAGGKSTALKSVVLAIIMAQTFGIAPAQSMTLTPFTQIGTYLNIADSIGKESLYQAEMNRAQNLLNSINSLNKPGEFSFVIMDEIFTGTNQEEGAAGAFGIAKCLATLPHSMCLVATHYKQLTELEKATDGVFKNFKVSVIIHPDGKITPTYVLDAGIADQKIALQLLQNAGFNNSILQAAQEALKNQTARSAA
jgi:DNA mismatch repair protein MutS